MRLLEKGNAAHRRRMAKQRRATRAVATGVVSAGAVAAAATLLQSLTSALDRPLDGLIIGMTILIVFLLGLAVEHGRVVQGRELSIHKSLRRWPLTKLNKTDPHELGVLPPPQRQDGSDGTDSQYVGRDLDVHLKAALEPASKEDKKAGREPASLVIVFGKANAGKSRTLYEAAKDSLGDRHVLIPEGSAALLDREILRAAVPRKQETVLWLDGLERYMEALTGDALDELTSSTPRMQIVGTVREDAYQTALDGTDENAASTRRWLRTARAFHLPTHFSEAEKQRYGRDLPLDEPVGEVFGANWQAGSVPHPPHPDDILSRGWVLRRDWKFLVPLVLALGCVGVIVVKGTGERGLFKPELAKELQRAKQKLAGTKPGEFRRDIDVVKRLKLRGSDEESYLITATDYDNRGQPLPGADEDGRSPRSDAVAIYDIEGTKLKDPSPVFEPDSPEMWTFEYRGAADLDGDLSQEILGGFSRIPEKGSKVGNDLRPTRGASRQLPLAIYRDDVEEAYKLRPLLPRRPRFSRPMVRRGKEPPKAVKPQAGGRAARRLDATSPILRHL